MPLAPSSNRGSWTWTVAVVLFLGFAGFWAGGRHRTYQEHAEVELAHATANVERALHSRAAAMSSLEEAREAVLSTQAELLKLHSQHLKGPSTHAERFAVPHPAPGSETTAVSRRAAADSARSKTSSALTRVCDPRRSTTDDPAARSLPILVFVCGVEGAGHHAIEAVLDELAPKVDLVATGYNPGMHAFAKNPNVSRAYQFPNISLAAYEASLRRHLGGRKLAGKPLVFDSRNSCVMHSPLRFLCMQQSTRRTTQSRHDVSDVRVKL